MEATEIAIHGTLVRAGGTYALTYRPTLYGRPVTRTLEVRLILRGATATTLICYGKRGGKVTMTAGEVIRAATAAVV